MDKKSNTALALLASSALLIISVFLPWASVEGIGSTDAFGESDGWIVLACAAVLGYVGWTRMNGKPVSKGWRIGASVAGILAFVIGTANYSTIDDAAALGAAFGIDASAGIGLWLEIAASILALIAMFFLARKEDGVGWFKGGTSTMGAPGTVDTGPGGAWPSETPQDPPASPPAGSPFE